MPYNENYQVKIYTSLSIVCKNYWLLTNPKVKKYMMKFFQKNFYLLHFLAEFFLLSNLQFL